MNKVIATFAVVLTLSAGNLFAADGNVTNLDDFGLSSMTVVSDAAGMEVRGMRSFANTAGWSSSELSTNNGGYQEHSAGSRNRRGSSLSVGATATVSGRVRFNSNGGFRGVAVGTVGGAFAYAR